MAKPPKKTVPGGALDNKGLPKKVWKEPRFGAMEAVDGKLPMAWRFSHRDANGPFGWSSIGDREFTEVVGKLAEFETKTWDQLHAARCHPIPISTLEDAAKSRLAEIEHDDLDELMSFHFSGPKRIWCIRDGNLMRVLWWDPEHKVYLTEKDREDRKKRKRRSR